MQANECLVYIWGAITFAFLGWINPWSELNWNIRQISMSKLSPSMRMKRCAKMLNLCFFCQVVATAGRCGNLCDSDFRQCVLWICLAQFSQGNFTFPCGWKEGAKALREVCQCFHFHPWQHPFGDCCHRQIFGITLPVHQVLCPRMVLILGGKTCYSYTDTLYNIWGWRKNYCIVGYKLKYVFWVVRSQNKFVQT